jgi:hypothetical protein
MVIRKKQTKNQEMKPCIKCGEAIHPKRLEILPNTLTCVSCSNVGKKRGVNIQVGEGDHTYNDIVIMEEDQYKQYLELEQSHRSTLAGKVALEEFETGTSESDFIEPTVDMPDETDNG